MAATATAGSWWVGENLTNQNSLRLGNIFSNNAPSGYQAVQAGNATDAAAFAASLSSGSPTPNLHDISWQIVGGPYATEAAANTALPGIQANTPAPGALAQAVPQIAGLEGIAKIFGDFFSGITDGKMWRSLGWLLLGILIFLIGLAMWIGKEATPLLKHLPIPV
jgi:hypothetical protein